MDKWKASQKSFEAAAAAAVTAERTAQDHASQTHSAVLEWQRQAMG
jgi:hypothetical protein